ncbi:hypothetical protein ACFYRG_48285 [Streptomyces mirabilis]
MAQALVAQGDLLDAGGGECEVGGEFLIAPLQLGIAGNQAVVAAR